MRISVPPGLAFLLCLGCPVFLVLGAGGTTQAASDSWSSTKKSTKKKAHHHKKKHKARATPASGAAPGAKAAPAEEEDDDTGGEEADDADGDAKAKPAKGDKRAKADGEEREGEASGEGRDKDGDDNGDTPVVRRKARHVTDDGSAAGAPVALELSAGPRAVHRTFDFNDPLTDHNPGATRPYSYSLRAAPAPFLDLAFYPGAFASRGIASQLGLVGRYEKLVGTKTAFDQGMSLTTFGQEFEVGLRGRLPLGTSEVGLTAAYGKHSFHVTETDPGPTATAVVPNVDYTFVRLGLDGRLDLGPVALAAHGGTRLVLGTGPLGDTWFPHTKTTSVEAGLSGAFSLTSVFSVVAGVDFLRYAFDFNPVPTSNAVVAGGAVDQYISGYLALRVSISGG